MKGLMEAARWRSRFFVPSSEYRDVVACEEPVWVKEAGQIEALVKKGPGAVVKYDSLISLLPPENQLEPYRLVGQPPRLRVDLDACLPVGWLWGGLKGGWSCRSGT
jgi:hypothetical protein